MSQTYYQLKAHQRHQIEAYLVNPKESKLIMIIVFQGGFQHDYCYIK